MKKLLFISIILTIFYSCEPDSLIEVYGCTDPTAANYYPEANRDDGSCMYEGCTDPTALNYDVIANIDDGSCTYLEIGVTYQGGIVFYLDGNGGGLIAAPSDQSSGAEWGCAGSIEPGAGGMSIGTGSQNTIAIVSSSGCATSGIAADICANLTLGGYSDWFLPSKNELNEMYVNLHLQGLGGFAYGMYWSSSQTSTYAWYQSFGFSSGDQGYHDKDREHIVRAVRAF